MHCPSHPILCLLRLRLVGLLAALRCTLGAYDVTTTLNTEYSAVWIVCSLIFLALFQNSSIHSSTNSKQLPSPFSTPSSCTTREAIGSCASANIGLTSVEPQTTPLPNGNVGGSVTSRSLLDGAPHTEVGQDLQIRCPSCLTHLSQSTTQLGPTFPRTVTPAAVSQSTSSYTTLCAAALFATTSLIGLTAIQWISSPSMCSAALGPSSLPRKQPSQPSHWFTRPLVTFMGVSISAKDQRPVTGSGQQSIPLMTCERSQRLRSSLLLSYALVASVSCAFSAWFAAASEQSRGMHSDPSYADYCPALTFGMDENGTSKPRRTEHPAYETLDQVPAWEQLFKVSQQLPTPSLSEEAQQLAKLPSNLESNRKQSLNGGSPGNEQCAVPSVSSNHNPHNVPLLPSSTSASYVGPFAISHKSQPMESCWPLGPFRCSRPLEGSRSRGWQFNSDVTCLTHLSSEKLDQDFEHGSQLYFDATTHQPDSSFAFGSYATYFYLNGSALLGHGPVPSLAQFQTPRHITSSSGARSVDTSRGPCEPFRCSGVPEGSRISESDFSPSSHMILDHLRGANLSTLPSSHVVSPSSRIRATDAACYLEWKCAEPFRCSDICHEGSRLQCSNRFRSISVHDLSNATSRPPCSKAALVGHEPLPSIPLLLHNSTFTCHWQDEFLLPKVVKVSRPPLSFFDTFRADAGNRVLRGADRCRHLLSSSLSSLRSFLPLLSLPFPFPSAPRNSFGLGVPCLFFLCAEPCCDPARSPHVPVTLSLLCSDQLLAEFRRSTPRGPPRGPSPSPSLAPLLSSLFAFPLPAQRPVRILGQRRVPA